jgi:putative pyoverdin transport system ATP-binding/permease protein
MEILSFLMRSSWRSMVFAIAGSFLSGIGNIGLLSLINATLTGSKSIIGVSVAKYAILCVLLTVVKMLSDLALIRMGQDTVFHLRMQLARQMLSAPVRKLEELGTPKLMASLTDDVYRIANLMTFIPAICISFTIVLGCFAYLAYLSWTALSVVLLFVAFAVVTYKFIATRGNRYFDRAREEDDALFKSFRGLTEGFKELKLHRERRRSFVEEVLHTNANNLRRHIIAGESLYTTAANYGQSLFLVLTGLLLFGLRHLTATNAGVLTGSVLTILFLRGPLETLVRFLPAVGMANSALRKVRQLGSKLVETSEAAPSPSPDGAARFNSLELCNVTHAYKTEDEEQFIIGPINLKITAGEIVFLIGGNGSGKTTLAKMMTCLYPPESGFIRFNDAVVTDENRDNYRQLFAVVFSDFYLFDSLLGLDKEDMDARANSYLEQLQLANKVKVTKGVLSTLNLSQGQRKRLALLTAYLEDKPFYIFDEWAANQDVQFREVFYHKVLPELKSRGKTLLVISHDDRYYHLADRIVKLEYGQIESISLSHRAVAIV